MTPETERAAIVRWLRGNGPWLCTRPLPLWGRLRMAWLMFRLPRAAVVAGCLIAADAIERGDHIKETSDDN